MSRTTTRPSTWLLAVTAVVAATAVVWSFVRPDPAREAVTHASARVATGAVAGALPAGHGGAAVEGAGLHTGAPGAAGPVPGAGQPLSGPARAVAQQFEQLAAMPPGDAAIALGRQVEAAITPETAPAYRDALLNTGSSVVERSAIAALARTADSNLVVALANDYGSLPAERRGRILQVLENAGNPAALDGLSRIVAADTSEKRSPVVMSALYGAASLGTMESIDYLIRQAATPVPDYALMALERVKTRQGVELIRSAAAGSKGSEQLSESMRGNLLRIASAAEVQVPR
jgi:hypothetical protein